MEALIYLLIKVCLVAVYVYAVIWVAESVSDKPFPAKIKQLLWLCFMLIVLLLLRADDHRHGRDARVREGTVSDTWIGGVATCQACGRQYTSSMECPACGGCPVQAAAQTPPPKPPCIYCGQTVRGGYCACV